MNDDGSGEDLPIIDVRSPSERLTDSGRDGLARFQARLRESHLDIAAVAWMVCVLGLTALELYLVLRQSSEFGGDSGWQKATMVASTGGILLTFGAMIGLALAFTFETKAARVALGMVVVAGLWAVVANVVGVAVSFHEESSGQFFLSLEQGTEGKVVSALIFVMQGGFGLIVFLIARSLIASRRAEPEIAETN